MEEPELAEDLEEDLYDGPSRGQIKREMLALQDSGARLMELSPKEWERFPLGEDMRGALQESLRIKEKTARKRHRKRLGKLMRNEDVAAIQELFDGMDNRHQEDNRRFHLLEKWRDRLIHEGDEALAEMLILAPEADRQHLRQLIRNATKEHELQKPPAAARKLFKYLRELKFA